MKKRHFVIKYHVYPYELMVIYNHTYDETARILKRRIPKEIHDEISSLAEPSYATTVMFSNNTTVIYIKPGAPKNLLQGIVVHEAFHAVTFLMDEIGARLSDDSEESYAYLIQFITSEIFKKLR